MQVVQLVVLNVFVAQLNCSHCAGEFVLLLYPAYTGIHIMYLYGFSQHLIMKILNAKKRKSAKVHDRTPILCKLLLRENSVV